MTTAAEHIADLDAEIAETGQDIALRRLIANAPAIERPFRAFVRGYRPDEVVGGIQQGDSLLVLSPTGLPSEFADSDTTRLRKNDKVTIDGRHRTVTFVDPVRVNGVLVRINVAVTG